MQSTTKIFGATFIAACAIFLSGCGAINAQNPSQGYKPVNATPDESGTPLMLKGYDVVSYFVANKDAVGSPQFKTDYKGIVFYFSSAENKALFDKEPMKYVPEYGGYCANGIVYSIPWGGDADTFEMIGGKLYIFGGKGSRDAFMLEPQKNVATANKYWSEEVSGSNALMHRTKRTTVAKVAHYKTGAELAAEVAKAKK